MSVVGSTMITWFNQYYDKETNLAAPGYEDFEVLVFLNNARDTWIKDRMFGKGFSGPGFEDNEKRVTDLGPFITSYTFTYDDYGDGVPFSNCRTYQPKSNLNVLYTISLEVQVTRSYPVVTKEWAHCDFIKNIDAAKFDVTPFNKPFFLRPKYFVAGANKYHVLCDAYTTDFMNVATTHYLRARWIEKTAPITAGSPFVYGDTIAMEIVNIAVREAMQVAQDQRFETKIIEDENIKTQ